MTTGSPSTPTNAPRTASRSSETRDQQVAVSSVSTQTPASSRASRCRGPLNRPCSQESPMARPSRTTLCPRNARTVAARDRHSHPRITRQGCRTPRTRRYFFTRSALAPAISSATSVSSTSDNRVTSAKTPAWASDRTRETPASHPSTTNPSYRAPTGLGRTRTETSVITPNSPSLPSTSCFKSGPAADAGAAPATHSPTGVATRTDSTMSSNRPYPDEAWPADRVAANPPIVARSKDCGTCPSVNPCSPSNFSASGPVIPACNTATRDTGSTETRRPSPARSNATTADLDPRKASTPPTTEVPPPNGTTAMSYSTQTRSTSRTSSGDAGCTTASGTASSPCPRRRNKSKYDSPPARPSRSASSTETAHTASSAVKASSVSSDGGITTGTSGSGSPSPTR